MNFKKILVGKFLTGLALTGMMLGTIGQSATLAAGNNAGAVIVPSIIGMIRAGTSVVVRTVTKVTPKEYQVGDKVRLVVVADVKVDGEVVINAGAGALGEVIVANNRGMAGIPAKIGIKVYSATAVDGSEILLTGNKVVEGKSNTANTVVCAVLCTPFALLFSGGSAVIPANDIIEATVISNARVRI